MARELQKLSPSTVKAATLEPHEKQKKLADGGRLYLLIKRLPSGGVGKYWRFDFDHMGKSATLPIGSYPDVSLKEARQLHQEARTLLKQGISPTEQRRKAKQQQAGGNTFKVLALEWLERERHGWTSEKHAQTVLNSLVRDVFPYVGDRPINEISSLDMLAVFRRIESRGALDMLRQIRQRCSNVFIYAIACARCENNPVVGLQKALKVHQSKHHAALERSQLPGFLRALEAYQGSFVTVQALKLVMLTMTRTQEIRFSRWAEFDFENSVWNIPAERMKMKRPHVVPLSTQSLQVLADLREVTGGGEYLFPQASNPRKVISENTMLYSLQRLGFDGVTVHGFRAMASTILNESGFNPDAIERQLAHTERSKVRAAYNRAEYLPERVKIMQWWGDFIESQRDGGNVVLFRQKAG